MFFWRRDPGSTMRARKAFPLTLLLLAFMGAVTVLSGRLPSAESNLDGYVQFSGRIAGEVVPIFSRQEGTVERLMVREGDRVPAGALLLRVGDDIEQRIEEIEGLVRELEQEKLARIEMLAALQPFRAVSLEMAEAGALFAAVELSLAETSNGDRQALASPKIRVAYDVDEARQRYEKAKARLSSVREVIAQIEKASNELSLVEAQLEELNRQRQGLRFRFKLGEVSTPVEAFVGHIPVVPGQPVARGQDLLELITPSTFFIKGTIDAEQASKIKEGQEALIYVHPLGEEPIRGVVGHIGADPETVTGLDEDGQADPCRAYKVQLIPEETPGRLFPGQSAVAIIRYRGDDRSGWSPPSLLAARTLSRSPTPEQGHR
jgi:multidrug resistance efflux pump